MEKGFNTQMTPGWLAKLEIIAIKRRADSLVPFEKRPYRQSSYKPLLFRLRDFPGLRRKEPRKHTLFRGNSLSAELEG